MTEADADDVAEPGGPQAVPVRGRRCAGAVWRRIDSFNCLLRTLMRVDTEVDGVQSGRDHHEDDRGE